MYNIKSRKGEAMLAERLNQKYGIPMPIAKQSARRAVRQPMSKSMRWLWNADKWVECHLQGLFDRLH